MGWRETRPRDLLRCGVIDTGVFAEVLRFGSRIGAAAGVERVVVNTTIANATTANVAIITIEMVATAISICFANVANCSVCLGPTPPPLAPRVFVLSNGWLPMSPQMRLQMNVLAVLALKNRCCWHCMLYCEHVG